MSARARQRRSERSVLRQARIGHQWVDGDGELWTVTNVKRADHELEMQSGIRKRYVPAFVLVRDYEQVEAGEG